MMAIIQCDRCHIKDKLESHHKKHKAKGGSDKTPNRRWLCTDCHDYQHAIDSTKAIIKIEEARLKVLYRRLETIERENTIPLIRERGYKSYWEVINGNALIREYLSRIKQRMKTIEALAVLKG